MEGEAVMTICFKGYLYNIHIQAYAYIYISPRLNFKADINDHERHKA